MKIFYFTGTLIKPEANYKLGRFFPLSQRLLYSFQTSYIPERKALYMILYLSDYQLTSDGWIIYENKQYYFSKEHVHMEEARKICQKNFADLIVIEKESKRRFLWQYVSRKPISYKWLKFEAQ